jgi:glycerol kinase
VSFVLALDQGTTSSRALVIDAEGRVRSTAQREFKQIFPRPGWVEHDPTEIWATQIGTALEAVAAAGIAPADLAGIGITNQRETTVVWERGTGRPLANAIVWQDRRTTADCARVEAQGLAPRIRERTGLVVHPYFSATKLAWLLAHVEGLRAAATSGNALAGTIDSWLAYKLTGHERHVTDVTNASRTMLCDIRTGVWDEELLGLFGIPRAMLPQIRSSSEVYGEAAGGHGLDGVPLAGIAGDQQAALAGQLCTSRGQAKCTYGTGCFLLLHTGVAPVVSTNRLVTTLACQRAGQPLQYALEGSVFIAGAAVQWLRDGLGIIRRSADVEALARTVEDSGGVYFVPAFSGLGAPYWDPRAGGTICGITRGTTAGHLARATLEAIAFQVADLVDAMERDVGPIGELRVDGGAAADDLLLELQADMLQRPIVRPRVTETTALGAGYMAGLAVGLWAGPEELADHWQVDRRFEPRVPAGRAAWLRGRWRDAVERARGWEPSGVR